MKKIHLLLLSVTLCVFSACHNDIWDAIDGLDSRVTKLEELCKEMNTNITSLQTIVDVLQVNDYITGIVEIKKDGKVIGYTITFGKHDPITIYHGQDGKDGADGKDGQNGSANAPVIGVAQDTDGVYYWTLNGEWLLDDNGNKLPVSGKDGQNGTNGSNGQDGTDGKDGQDGEDGKDGANGQDGKDGITPQLKIEDGYWYISYDNGATWTQLGKATGEDGKDGQNGADGKDGKDGADGEDGKDGDSMFQSVTQDENYVYFTLADGTVIKIAKGSSNNQPNGDDIIEFKDLSVPLGLLKTSPNIDVNNDGYISYNEAANYKGSISFSGSDIRYFEEFKYFTGVTSCNFSRCTNLLKIILPENISTIKNNCFLNCSLLANITIPQKVVDIEDFAFYGCSKMTKIEIPNNVRTIGGSAFGILDALQSISFPENLMSVGNNIFYYSGYIRDYYYPDTIYWNTIYYPTSLKELIIPPTNDRTKRVTKSFIFGENVEVIPSYICYNAIGLTEIIIPNKVKTINSYAFCNCTNVTYIKIGTSVNYIDSKAFYGCNTLKSIYCTAKTPPTIKDTSVFPTALETIYVPRASVEEYKALWSDYADKIIGYDFE